MLKTRRRIFFAIPYDTATKALYDEVARELGGAGWDVAIGTDHLGPSQELNEIEAFKSQNTELFKQFVDQIQKADVVVADLTNNNPNVHLELGIALNLNKNILRVTGRDIVEVGFDLKGFENSIYKSKGKLTDQVKGYLEIFTKIKALDFDVKLAPLYKAYPEERALRHEIRREGNVEIWVPAPLHTIQGFVMRDGKFRARLKFNTVDNNPNDWFGVHFRSRNENPWLGGYLVYLRQSGSVEILENPSARVVAKKNFFPNGVQAEKRMTIEMEGDSIVVMFDGSTEKLEYSNLSYQSVGLVTLSCYRSEGKFWDIELVCRDTINPPPSVEG